MKVERVIFFTNGNVMVFDNKGDQMPELQGFILDVGEKLKANCDKNTIFSYGNWRSGMRIDCNFKWYFEKKDIPASTGR